MIYLTVFFSLTTAIVAQSGSLTTKMEQLTTDVDDLVRDYQDSKYKMTSKIRTRLIVLLLQLIPAEIEIQHRDDPDLQKKFDSIVLLLEKKMRIKYERIRERITVLLTRFLGPTLVPFTLMQAPSQDEIQQALLTFQPTPPTSAPTTSNDVDDNFNTDDRQFLPIGGGANRLATARAQFLPLTQTQRSNSLSQLARPQISYLSIGQQYPPQYFSTGQSTQYYWPASQQQVPYTLYQDPSSSQWYWSQPLPQQSQRPIYYWNYPNSVYAK